MLLLGQRDVSQAKERLVHPSPPRCPRDHQVLFPVAARRVIGMLSEGHSRKAPERPEFASLVSNTPVGHQSLFQKAPRRCVVSLLARQCSKPAERPPDDRDFPLFPRSGETLLLEGTGRL